MILVNGCSLTHGNINALEGNYLDQTWGFQVGKHLNDDVTNISKSGIGSQYIVKRTMDWILRYGNPDIVLIAWPTTCRFEWPEEYRKHHSSDFGFVKYKNGTTNKDWCTTQLQSNIDEFDFFTESRYITFPFGDLYWIKKRFDKRGLKDTWQDAWKARNKGDPKAAIVEFLYNYKHSGNAIRWFIENKIYNMILLKNFLEVRNIKYYWSDWDNVINLTKHAVDGIPYPPPMHDGIPYKQHMYPAMNDGDKWEISYLKEDLNIDNWFVQDSLTHFSRVNGLLPGWIKRTFKTNDKPVKYTDAHYQLDWHEWFGAEFANFIKTGKNITNKRNFDKMHDEFLKAKADPDRDPPGNFIEDVAKCEEKAVNAEETFVYD